jgi:hypothetical protein
MGVLRRPTGAMIFNVLQVKFRHSFEDPRAEKNVPQLEDTRDLSYNKRVVILPLEASLSQCSA